MCPGAGWLSSLYACWAIIIGVGEGCIHEKFKNENYAEHNIIIMGVEYVV